RAVPFAVVRRRTLIRFVQPRGERKGGKHWACNPSVCGCCAPGTFAPTTGGAGLFVFLNGFKTRLREQARAMGRIRPLSGEETYQNSSKGGVERRRGEEATTTLSATTCEPFSARTNLGLFS